VYSDASTFTAKTVKAREQKQLKIKLMNKREQNRKTVSLAVDNGSKTKIIY